MIDVKRILLATALSLVVGGAFAQSENTNAGYKQQIGAFLDEWHDDAAHSRLSYFDKIASDGIYIGTDKTERWTREEFEAWAKRYFARPSAWTLRPISRHIYVSDDKNFIWFDEQLTTSMGLCQASGVIRKTTRGFKIEHYQLSVAIPNDLVDQIHGMIENIESKTPM
jgi:hypothetical protein